MRPTEITLAVFEKYQPAELAEVAQKMAQAQSDMESAEAEKKVSDGVFNERIKTHAAEVSELAQRYNKGGETAQIGCTIRYDIPEVGKKSYIRMDTEETVEVHDMTPGEKQETLQFPLTASESKPEETPVAEPKVPKVPKVKHAPEEPKPPTEITFKDIQSIAAHVATITGELRDSALLDMQTAIAQRLSAQKTIIGPDGRVETIDSSETAMRLAKAWLDLALQPPPPNTEEVTRICPYPGCILFAEHDGVHEFPATYAKPDDVAAPEPQPQKEEKPKRKRRPPAEPPQPGAPA